MIESRTIKFYLSNKVNKSKKEKILTFLKECQTVENYLLNYYWEHFDIIIKSKSKIDMNYNNTINFKDVQPVIKSHHFYTVLRQTYEQLKSLQSNIQNKLYFKFDEDKLKQRIYNYCKGFCFDWDNLHKSVNKQLTKNKKDKTFVDFLISVKEYIEDQDKFNQMKQDVEHRFYEIKSNFKIPQKKSFQIWVDTFHTIVVEKKEFEWFFIIDNNEKINSRVFDSIIIPVKYSDYHKKILEGKNLKNTFNLKLTRNGRIEISAIYEVNVEYIQNKITNIIGVDIGLKKLLTSSEKEIVEQNNNIIKKAKQVVKMQSNRQSLEEHLKVKYNDRDYKIGNKRYFKKQGALTDYVKSDNRFKIKEFLKDKLNDHIIMEDLDIGYCKTYSKEVNYLLRRMGIQNIKNDMLKYAKEMGIKISLVNPAFTSQQCPCCGYISKDNRKTQETFCCVECGYTENADVNASINIKNRYNDERIKLNTPFWKVKEILNVIQ